MDLIAIDPERVIRASYEYRAELVFRPRGVELRLILELEQKLQVTVDSEFLVESSLGRHVHTLDASGMTAATIRPVQRPEPFRGCPLLEQKLAVVVENQNRERPVKYALTLMAERLAHGTQPTVRFVYQNQSVGICHNLVIIDIAFMPSFINEEKPRYGSRSGRRVSTEPTARRS
jgi:hypothetical protein